MLLLPNGYPQAELPDAGPISPLFHALSDAAFAAGHLADVGAQVSERIGRRPVPDDLEYVAPPAKGCSQTERKHFQALRTAHMRRAPGWLPLLDAAIHHVDRAKAAVITSRKALPSAIEYLARRYDVPEAPQWPPRIALLLGEYGGLLDQPRAQDMQAYRRLETALWGWANKLRVFVYTLSLPPVPQQPPEPLVPPATNVVSEVPLVGTTVKPNPAIEPCPGLSLIANPKPLALVDSPEVPEPLARLIDRLSAVDAATGLFDAMLREVRDYFLLPHAKRPQPCAAPGAEGSVPLPEGYVEVDRETTDAADSGVFLLRAEDWDPLRQDLEQTYVSWRAALVDTIAVTRGVRDERERYRPILAESWFSDLLTNLRELQAVRHPSQNGLDGTVFWRQRSDPLPERAGVLRHEIRRASFTLLELVAAPGAPPTHVAAAPAVPATPVPQDPPPDVPPVGKATRIPSEKAMAAWRLFYFFGISNQTEIAKTMVRNGTRATQGEVSKWLREVEAFQKAGGTLSLPEPARPAVSVDPKDIEIGEEQQGRSSYQRGRKDDDDSDD